MKSTNFAEIENLMVKNKSQAGKIRELEEKISGLEAELIYYRERRKELGLVDLDGTQIKTFSHGEIKEMFGYSAKTAISDFKPEIAAKFKKISWGKYILTDQP